MDDELQRYRIDQAERWLAKVRKLVSYERAMREAAEVQYEMADGLRGIDYSRDQVDTSPTADAIPNAVIAHDEAGETMVEIADSARERVKQAAEVIARLNDVKEATCLRLYYVEAFATWRHVRTAMSYTEDGLKSLRRRALLNVYEIMPHDQRDPLPLARPREYD